jgi:hypothetical protein
MQPKKYNPQEIPKIQEFVAQENPTIHTVYSLTPNDRDDRDEPDVPSSQQRPAR